MKKFLATLILILMFQTPSQADDIRDFQVEGMSIGDSALDYFSEEEIKNNKYYYNNNEFSGSEIPITSNLYKTIHIAYLSNDSKYIIHNIAATILYTNNIEDCYKKRDEIVEDIYKIFSNTKPKFEKLKHSGDKSGKSTLDNAVFKFKNGDMAVITCYDWSTKMGYLDHLRIGFRTKKFKDFINYKAYK